MRWNTVLFDLDGTVTDPKEGITCAVAYALRQQGIIADPDTLTRSEEHTSELQSRC